MPDTILITGATGRVGAEVLRQLPGGLALRAGVRQPERARASTPRPDVEYVALDFTDPATFAPALTGVSSLFLIWPAVKIETVFTLLEAADAAGVRQIVFLSIVVADQLEFLPHRRVEKWLETAAAAGRMSYTFLRASYFMQNLDTIHRADIRDRHEIFIPAGGGTVNLVDVRDVAAVAVRALLEPAHRNQAYRLTGSDTLSFAAVAGVFSEVLQQEIRFTSPPIPQFLWRMTREHRYSLSLAAFMCVEYTAARFHLGTHLDSQLPGLLERDPITLREYVHDFRTAWV